MTNTPTDREKVNECWVWRGTTSGGRHGLRYGVVNKHRKTKLAHRLSYETFVGEIPKGLEIDHLCRNTLCVNPKHLEAVTHKENILRGNGFSGVNARKTHCPRGHKYDRFYKPELRTCRICILARMKEYYKRKKGEK